MILEQMSGPSLSCCHSMDFCEVVVTGSREFLQLQSEDISVVAFKDLLSLKIQGLCVAVTFLPLRFQGHGSSFTSSMY